MDTSVRPKRVSEKLNRIAAIGIPAVIESIISVIIGSIDTKMISGLGKARSPRSPSRPSPS